MQLSTRGRYAVMAMVHLAMREAIGHAGCDRPVTLAEVAGAEMLSLSYLEQLFGRLRRAGLVVSARGPGGGYRLARPAAEISVGQVMMAVEEAVPGARCGGDSAAGEAAPESLARRCRTHDLWAELDRQIHMFLAGVTLADIVGQRVRGRAAPALSAQDRADERAGAAGRGAGLNGRA